MVAYLAENRDMRHVDEIVVDLHHVLDGGAGIGKRELEVFDGLVRLRAKVTRRAHQLVLHIEAKLPRNVDQPVGAGRLDHVAVPGRLCERLRIRKTDIGGHGTLPVFAAPDGLESMRENTPPVKGSHQTAARLLVSFVLQKIVVAIFMPIARPLTVFLPSVAARNSKNSLFSVITHAFDRGGSGL